MKIILLDISYEMHLRKCGLTTLETEGGEKIRYVCKILNGYENIDRNIFFTVKGDRRSRVHEIH